MRHLYLRTALAVALMVPAVASAFTTRELSNVAWIATYTTNPNFNKTSLSQNPYIDSHGLTAERVDDTHLRINGFMGCLDFVFTLTDASGNATPNGTYLCINYDDYAVNVSNSDYVSQEWQMLQCVQNGYSYPLYTYKRTKDLVLYRITKSGDEYTMSSTSPVFIHGSADSSIKGYIIRIFDNVELNSYLPNAVVTDRFYEEYGFNEGYGGITDIYPSSSEQIREYPVRLEMDYDNNRFTILNFGNNGYGMRQNLRYYNNLYRTSLSTPGKFIIGGTFDPVAKTLSFDKNQFAKPVWSSSNGYTEDMFNFQLERLDLEGNTTVDELLGTYDDTKGVHHNGAENGWVSNGGKRRTFENMSMEVETYTYYLNQLLAYRLNFEGGYYDTQLEGLDVTLQTEFVRDPNETSRSANSDPLADVQHTVFHSGNKVGSPLYDNVKEWGIVPVMNVIRNEQYVDSYELMAVPGSYNTAAELHPHLGEAIQFRRVFVNEGDTLIRRDDKPIFNAAEEKNGLYKPGDFRIRRNSTGTAPETYTFFIKANYKPETGLTPTYHDIYPHTFSADVPTAADIIANDNMRIESELGAIVVRNASYPVAIYDIAGRQVYLGTDDRIELPAGIYVAKCGSYAAKLHVR